LAGGYVSCMGGIDGVHGDDVRGGGLRIVQATEEEQAAIRAMLSRRAESAPAGAGAGRASALAWAGLKLAAIVLLAAGVGVGLGDGDEFDDVGCSVAQQPGGTSHGARSAQARERAGGKLPGSDGVSAGGSGDGGPGGRPECEVRAATCAHRMADGQCQRSNQQCRLFAGAGEAGKSGKQKVESRDLEVTVPGVAARAVVKAVEAAMERLLAGRRFPDWQKGAPTTPQPLSAHRPRARSKPLSRAIPRVVPSPSASARPTKRATPRYPSPRTPMSQT
jgi:hypothetical protein